MKLVIVESPGKIKKIQSYLGADYIVDASFGHIRDLDPKNISVDIENNFKPTYAISKDKGKVVSKLKSLSGKASETILAADQDREGEAIANSLKEVLKLKDPKRIIFTEITKTAIDNAIKNPTVIDKNQVYAQQTRRILDRIVGYQLSPLLWKHLPGTKSAGRVQSVLVRIIVEQEEKIRSTENELRIKMYGEFNLDGKRKNINSTLYENEKIKEFKSLKKSQKLLNSLTKECKFYIKKIEKSDNKKNPPPPFITSTLQQDASGKLRFPTKKTMMVAQKLYEKGLITYMRTDSTVLSKAALGMLKNYIIDKYGKKYYKGRNYTKNKKGAQEAHEAIRPTKMSIDEKKLNNDELKLFNLILNRTLASQMSAAVITNQKIYIKTDNINWERYHFQTIINNIKFDGYLKVYHNQDEDDKLLNLNENDNVNIVSITSTEDYKELPKRLNEAGLVRYLEKRGIGRPSTYSSLISKVLDRKYIEIKNIPGVKKDINYIKLNSELILESGKRSIAIGSERNKLMPTELGFKSNKFLIENFSNILEENFTANLEKQLDMIASGKLKWTVVLEDFYKNLKPIIEKLNIKVVIKSDDVDELLGEKDGNRVYFGKSKFGKYIKKKENGKWKFCSVDSKPSLDKACELLIYPKFLGKKVNTIVTLNNGKYGYYIKYGTINQSLPKDINPDDITLESALEYVAGKGDKNVLKGFVHKNKLILVKKGPYGNYIQTMFKGKKVNLKLNKKDIPEEDELIEIVKSKLK